MKVYFIERRCFYKDKKSDNCEKCLTPSIPDDSDFFTSKKKALIAFDELARIKGKSHLDYNLFPYLHFESIKEIYGTEYREIITLYEIEPQ